MIIKPMLSADLDGVDLSTLRYPVMASPKLDGLRCIIWEGVAYSRNWKPFRNHHLQNVVKNLHGLDGEIIVGEPTGGTPLERSKAVTAFMGEPDFTMWAFDSVLDETRDLPFFERWDNLQHAELDEVKRVGHVVVHDHAGLLLFEQQCLAAGYEGICVRDPHGPYKHGRSTLNEGYLMKLKRFVDGEGIVASIQEGRRNSNILLADAFGHAKRQTLAENMIPNGMVGTLTLTDGMVLAAGIMTHAERADYFAHPEKIVGKKVHWRAFGYGVKDALRHPRYYGIVEE